MSTPSRSVEQCSNVLSAGMRYGDNVAALVKVCAISVYLLVAIAALCQLVRLAATWNDASASRRASSKRAPNLLFLGAVWAATLMRASFLTLRCVMKRGFSR